ncbi:MAG: hypothetical protein JWM11_2252 [Planctomycetaceae bacterium]|nr:hypothetical protein [Planctomycetaceae bacterium]
MSKYGRFVSNIDWDVEANSEHKGVPDNRSYLKCFFDQAFDSSEERETRDGLDSTGIDVSSLQSLMLPRAFSLAQKEYLGVHLPGESRS